VHKAWTWAWGNADELASTAALLNKIDGTLVETYVDRSGQTAEQVEEWMRAETWFTAAEAITAGLADRLADGTPATQEPEGSQAGWNLRAYLRPPTAAQTSAARNQAESLQAHIEHRNRQQQRTRALAIANPIG
jgi:ATP-dependent Clp protease, protease subunit